MNNKEFDKHMKTNLTNLLDDLGADSERKSYQMTGPAPPNPIDAMTCVLIKEHGATIDDLFRMINWIKTEQKKK